jgi:uncharacterized protein YjcR
MSHEKKIKASELHRQGASYSEIAYALGISKSTAHSWVNENGTLSRTNEQNERTNEQNTPQKTMKTMDNFKYDMQKSQITPRSQVRLKEPQFVAEQRNKISKLEALTAQLKEQIAEQKTNELNKLKKRVNEIRKYVVENNGEHWYLDEFQTLVSELSEIADEIIHIDPPSQDWIQVNIGNLVEVIKDAIQCLEDEGTDSGYIEFPELE